jgi:hypothetical protein
LPDFSSVSYISLGIIKNKKTQKGLINVVEFWLPNDFLPLTEIDHHKPEDFLE